MNRTIAIAGASGFVGRHLQETWTRRGALVRTIGRSPSNDASWGDPDALSRVLDGADVLVNLAGRSVSCRYNKRNADQILGSRVETTAALGRAMVRTGSAPAVWVNASTGTIYRDARDRPMSETDGEIGSGFSVAVARAWEHELETAPVDVRKVALRMSIVLGSGGGAVNPLINLARLGFGGPMGDGGQVFSWVHVDDVVRAIDHIVASDDISGPVNVASPNAVTNAALMATVRAAVGRRVGVPCPAWLLEAGARVIRTEAELVLKSRWVDPAVLRTTGFAFAHPELHGALAQIVDASPPGLLATQLG